MIVQSIHSTTGVTSTGYKNTVYTTLEDPVTHKRVIEVVEHLYDSIGRVEPANAKGRDVDIKA
jgi:hypothetical protein